MNNKYKIFGLIESHTLYFYLRIPSKYVEEYKKIVQRLVDKYKKRGFIPEYTEFSKWTYEWQDQFDDGSVGSPIYFQKRLKRSRSRTRR